jgi:peptidyl-tRNA hydrolase
VPEPDPDADTGDGGPGDGAADGAAAGAAPGAAAGAADGAAAGPGGCVGVWALQVVVRVERDPRPTATAACEAVASAVAALLAAGEWADLVARWRPAPRKVVRRARGVAWERCLLLDGISISREGASARALPPGPVDALPPELAKLQVGGTDLEDPDRRHDLALDEGWPGLLVAVTPAVAMTAGKMAAQCGHASQMALEAMTEVRAGAWAATGFQVSVRFPSAEAWAGLRAVAPVEICDAGHTEIPPGTPTVLATWR